MHDSQTHKTAQIKINNKGEPLVLQGDWTVSGIVKLAANYLELSYPQDKKIIIDGKQIDNMDSAGILILQRIIQHLQKQNTDIELINFSKEHQSLFKLLTQEENKLTSPDIIEEKNIQGKPRSQHKGNYTEENAVFLGARSHEFTSLAEKLMQDKQRYNLFYLIGKFIYRAYGEFIEFLTFLGETIVSFVRCIYQPKRIQWRAFLNVIDQTGFRALPIVALLSFSIGVVLSYQMGQQLKVYGANIYIVVLLGVSVLQEFAPLITAIIVAGRTSSAFTAQIGTMKINEEIDALRSMGLSPNERLVLPKLFGLLVALPLLTLWADLFGLLGGMIMSKQTLGVSYYSFMHTFPQVIDLSTYINGIVKAPVFAILIAVVGCFQGFQVVLSADSVGRQTTKSVVQSIFLIIIADAIFSIILGWQTIS